MIEEEAELQRNCEAINTLLDITQTLARQGISFRGSSSEKDGNGNFRQITSLVARHSPSFNIVDTLEAAQATIVTLHHLRDDETNFDNQIEAAVIFSAQYEIDAEDEYQRNHRPRRRPRRFDKRPETTANLTFTNFYRK